MPTFREIASANLPGVGYEEKEFWIKVGKELRVHKNVPEEVFNRFMEATSPEGDTDLVNFYKMYIENIYEYEIKDISGLP